MQNEELKNMSIKLPAPLHAEVKEFVEKNGMTLSEFVALALQDELHPKNIISEEKSMNNEKMRTMAFQVPESLFQRIKEYLHNHNITQRDFVLGLVTDELDRDQAEREAQEAGREPIEENDKEVSEEQDEYSTETVFEDGEENYAEEETESEELTEESSVTDDDLPPEIEEDEDEKQNENDYTEDEDEFENVDAIGKEIDDEDEFGDEVESEDFGMTM